MDYDEGPTLSGTGPFHGYGRGGLTGRLAAHISPWTGSRESGKAT